MKDKLVNIHNRFNQMKQRHRVATIIIAVSLVWMLSGLLLGGNPHQDLDSAEAKLITVKIQKIASIEQEQYISAYGITEASVKADIAAETNGKVVKISDKEGQAVSKGEVIIWLDKREKKEALAFARSLLAQRQLEFKSARSLSKKGLRSDVNLANSKANLSKAIAEDKRAEIELANTEIHSPFDGILERIYVDVGVVTSETQKKTMVRVISLEPLLVIAHLSANEIQHITQNMVVSADINEVKYDGVVSYLSKVADENTRTFRIEMTINNPNMLPEGINADLKIYTGFDKVHVIPASAISLGSNGDLGIKFVDENSIVHFQKIDIIVENNQGMTVSGINDNVRIITVGHEFVKIGSKVLVSDVTPAKEK
jgi:multidrug efflux system membrane fusion protein